MFIGSSRTKKVSPKKIEDIDYTTAEKQFNDVKKDDYKAIKIKNLMTKLPTDFLSKLYSIQSNATVLKVSKPYCDEMRVIIPFPLVINDIYRQEYENVDLQILIDTGVYLIIFSNMRKYDVPRIFNYFSSLVFTLFQERK